MSLKPATTPTARRRRQQAQRAQRHALTSTTPTNVLLSNIRTTYLDALDHETRSWYPEAHEHAVTLAERYSLPLPHAVGVIAALSPSTAWERNLQLADDLLATGDCAHAYGDAIRKAQAIANGADPLATLGGRKVRSFYANILRPYRPGPVTIDRHAYSIALLGTSSGETERRTYTLPDADLKRLDRPGVYALIAACYRTVAREFGVLPHDVQSITWDYWRNHYAYATVAYREDF